MHIRIVHFILFYETSSLQIFDLSFESKVKTPNRHNINLLRNSLTLHRFLLSSSFTCIKPCVNSQFMFILNFYVHMDHFIWHLTWCLLLCEPPPLQALRLSLELREKRLSMGTILTHWGVCREQFANFYQIRISFV